MKLIYSEIEKVPAEEIGNVLKAVLRRYGELFPDWEISMISIDKSENRIEQIDQMIHLMEKLKTFP